MLKYSGLNFFLFGWIYQCTLNLSFQKSFSTYFWFWALGWICYSGLILSFWAEFVILDWSSHFRLNCSPYYVLCFSFWNEYVIVGWFCHSGLISSLWTEFLTLGWRLILLFWVHLVMQEGLRHSTTLTFWNEFLILGWIYQSAITFSSGLNSSIEDFDILRWISHSRTIFLFWAKFIILY